jgi:GT2 family glycosyltransferase
MYSNDTVIFIPVFGNFEVFENCILSILKFTPRDVPIFIFDDATPGESLEAYLIKKQVSRKQLFIHRNSTNLGFVENCNLFIRNNTDKNIIICNSDIMVSYGWFESMVKPMETLENLATVTALTNNGTIATVKIGNDFIPRLNEDELFELNQKLMHSSDEYFPIVHVGVGHCILITSLALLLVGEFDVAFSPGYGEEVDFCLKAKQLGLIHVLGHTFVTHVGGETFGKKRIDLQRSHHEIIKSRYPNYEAIVSSPFSHNLIETLMMRALISYRGPKILIDLRLFDRKFTGTSRLLFETARTLNNLMDENLYLLVTEDIVDFFREELGTSPKYLTAEACNQASFDFPAFDVVYIPHQISDRSRFKEYRIWARRVVFSQLDFISFDNAEYFAQASDYFNYIHSTKTAFLYADAITFISESTRNQAKIKGLISENTMSRVIYPGTDHFENSGDSTQDNSNSPQRLLLYGAAFSHKNFEYAGKIFRELIRIKPNLQFVVVYSTPTYGARNPFLDLDFQSEFKNNLEVYTWITDLELKDEIRKAAVVLYPTTKEGFGFVPFEAAKFHTPTLFAKHTSLKEIFPGTPYYLTYRLNTDVQTILRFLISRESQISLVKYVQQVSLELTWEKHGEKLLEFLTLVCYRNPSINREHLFFTFSENHQNHQNHFVRAIRALGRTKLCKKLLPIGSERRVLTRRILKV